jgi:hypothetical protein
MCERAAGEQMVKDLGAQPLSLAAQHFQQQSSREGDVTVESQRTKPVKETAHKREALFGHGPAGLAHLAHIPHAKRLLEGLNQV